MARVLLPLLGALLTVSCGGALPPQADRAALHRDLERLVELADAEGWSIDRVEADEALPSALDSVCRTQADTREELLQWLDERIAAEGGDVKAMYKTRGKDLGEVSELLTLTRVRMLLAHSIASADADCPFWLEPEKSFRGRQILDDRWFVSMGGGGKGIVVRQAGQSDLHFGGAARLMLGRGFGRHATLLTGFELGGSAAFPKGEDGKRGDLSVTADIVAPIVYRHRRVNGYWEIEAGYIAHTAENEFNPAHGFRVGVSLGGSASRRRWIFPGAAFGIHYERIAENDTLHFVKLGFRVALDIAR